MEAQRLCAYNQTRECFLGLEVADADVSYAELKELLAKLALKSGEGLWMSPFRGIPDSNLRAPLDLVYLDEDCRVIEVVESFPTFHVTPSSPRADSVLALPTHSIYSSQTQSGDQLVLCVAEEMQHRLERFSSSSGVSGGTQNAAQMPAKLVHSGSPGVVVTEECPKQGRSSFLFPDETEQVEEELEDVKPARSWLQRWWAPDPKKSPEKRTAPRGASYGLEAYYWTGGAPQSHSVRDISSTGLYIVTEERWYPGTLILMTLQAADYAGDGNRNSISVHSRAVRWGNDGVGLQFIPQDTLEAHNGLNSLVHGADKSELDQFLESLWSSNE
jgi:hypothetical protein